MRVDDYLRSFGMSGFVVSEDLRGLERDFGIDLGHLPHSQEGSAEYYPQFERSVRLEAASMAKQYELFFCLEQSIRKLITEALEETSGANWWETNVPQAIRDEVTRLVRTEVDSGITRRSERHIDYTTFGQLGDIISSNWEVFATVFTSQRAVQKVMSSLNLLRGPIAHCCPLSEDEIDRLDLTVKDWFRMLG
jgi:hypothetical protein